MMRRLWLALVLVFCAARADAYTNIIVDEGFSNAQVTCTSTGAGAWNAAIWSCGHEPTGSDWVQINHAVTISGTRTAWTVYVAAGGSLTCNGAGSLTFSDTAPGDSSKFSTGLIVLGTFNCVRTAKTSWARTTAGISNGATTFTVDACSGWVAGDRLLLGDTRENATHNALDIAVGTGSTTTTVKLSTVAGGAPSAVDDFYNGRRITFKSGAMAGYQTAITDYVGATTTATIVVLPDAPANGVTAVIVDTYHPEVMTIDSITGDCAVTLTSGVGHAYTTARDHAGTVERLIPVGNLTRDFVIKSASGAVNRAHVLFNADAVIDVEYVGVQDIGRTRLGALDNDLNHVGRYAMHIHHMNSAATIIGNVVERSRKWAYVVHASNGSLLRDNIGYDSLGWCQGTEDATEVDNVFDHNLCVLVFGDGSFNNGFDNPGQNGSAFWMQGQGNILTGNVAMNSEQTGFSLWEKGPIFTRPIAEFSRNEAIANFGGLVMWSPGSPDTLSVIDHFYEWHSIAEGYYGYGIINTEFNDYYSRGDPDGLFGSYNWFGDYDAYRVWWNRPNIQNKGVGFYAPYGSARNLGFESFTRVINVNSGYFYNVIDILVRPRGLSGGTYPFTLVVTDTTFGNASGIHLSKDYLSPQAPTNAYKLQVVNYNGTTDDFEVYASEQAGSYTVPLWDGTHANSGCPTAMLTNDQCWAAHMQAIFGEVMPLTAHTRANIEDYVVDSGVSAVGRPRVRKR